MSQSVGMSKPQMGHCAQGEGIERRGPCSRPGGELWFRPWRPGFHRSPGVLLRCALVVLIVRSFLAAPATWAAPPPSKAARLFVLAQGNCRDAALLSDTRNLARLLSTKEGLDVLDEHQFRDVVGGPPERSLSELEGLLGAARTAFFHGHLNRAKRLAEEVVDGASRLPPSPERWELTAQADAARFLIFKARGQMKEGTAALINILRIVPNYRLDESFYSPDTRAMFEQLRKQVASAAKTPLELSSQPTGAAIFVDGVPFGRTPTTLALLPGTYTVELAHEGKRGLSRKVEVSKSGAGAAKVHAELEVEWALSPERLPCIARAADGDGASEVARAVKMGAFLGVAEVVSVVMEKPLGATGILNARRIEVASARQVREGAIRVFTGRENPEGLEELARFLATGARGMRLIDRHEWELQREIARAERTSLLAPPPERTRVRTLNRPVLWALSGASTAGLVTGVVFGLKARSNAKRFNAAYSGAGPQPGTLAGLDAMRDRSKQQTKWSRVAFGVSAAAATLGLATYVIGVPAGPDGMQLGIGPSSVSMAIPLQ